MGVLIVDDEAELADAIATYLQAFSSADWALNQPAMPGRSRASMSMESCRYTAAAVSSMVTWALKASFEFPGKFQARLTRSTPEKSLLAPKSKTGGRNNSGRITTRHIGGGHKQAYRIIDFKRYDKDGVPAKVAHIEYDPNRTARTVGRASARPSAVS